MTSVTIKQINKWDNFRLFISDLKCELIEYDWEKSGDEEPTLIFGKKILNRGDIFAED